MDQIGGDFAVRLRRLDRIGTPVSEQCSISGAEFIALSMAAEIIVIIKYENAGVGTHRFSIEVRRGETTDSATYDDEVVSLASIFVRL